MSSKLYKIWNKTTCYEIYFRPVDDFKVEVITYLNGDPFVNPRSTRIHEDDANVEVWDIQDARDNWDAWTIHGGYEVSEVEDYLRQGSMNLQKREKQEQKIHSAMTGKGCLLYTSPSPRDRTRSRMPSSA